MFPQSFRRKRGVLSCLTENDASVFSQQAEQAVRPGQKKTCVCAQVISSPSRVSLQCSWENPEISEPRRTDRPGSSHRPARMAWNYCGCPKLTIYNHIYISTYWMGPKFQKFQTLCQHFFTLCFLGYFLRFPFFVPRLSCGLFSIIPPWPR